MDKKDQTQREVRKIFLFLISTLFLITCSRYRLKCQYVLQHRKWEAETELDLTRC